MFKLSTTLNTIRNAASAGALITAITATAVLVGFTTKPVDGAGMYEPVSLTADATISAGSPVQCNVTLTGGPETVTIYSNPPGVVSYTTTVSSPNATIIVPTNPNAASGSVTLHVVTDGETSASTSAMVEQEGSMHRLP